MVQFTQSSSQTFSPEQERNTALATHEIRSEVTGSVWKVLVEQGDEIELGAHVMILESMKMEFDVSTNHGGVLVEILVEEGSHVEEGEVLATVEASP